MSDAAPTPGDANTVPMTYAPPVSPRRQGADRRLVYGLLISLLVHGLILSLQLGLPGLDLPGLDMPWSERRVTELQLKLSAAPPAAAFAEASQADKKPPEAEVATSPTPPESSPAPLPAIPSTGMRARIVEQELPAPTPPPPVAARATPRKALKKSGAKSPPPPAPPTLNPETTVAQAQIDVMTTLNPTPDSFVVAPPTPGEPGPHPTLDVEAPKGTPEPSVQTSPEPPSVDAQIAKQAQKKREQDAAEKVAQKAADDAQARQAAENAARQAELAKVREAQAQAQAQAQQEALQQAQARREADKLAQQRAQELAQAQEAQARQQAQDDAAKKAEQEKQEKAQREAAELAARREEEAKARELEAKQRAEQAAQQAAQQAAAQAAKVAQQAAAEAAKEQAAREQAVREQLAREQAAKDQAARDQAAQAARDQAAKEQAARDQAARDQAAKDQAARDQAAREQAGRDQAARQQADAAARAGQSDRAGSPGRRADSVFGNTPGGGNTGSQDLASRALDQARKLDIPSTDRPAPRLPIANADDPRRRSFLGGLERDVRLKLYMESWRQKVERNGTLNFPRSITDKIYANPIVTVSIRSDGSLENVTFSRSSGRPELDEAIRRIVLVLSPYSAFPPDLKREFDVIEIRRVWTFDDGVKILEDVR